MPTSESEKLVKHIVPQITKLLKALSLQKNNIASIVILLYLRTIFN
jgi:hypothetical protein